MTNATKYEYGSLRVVMAKFIRRLRGLGLTNREIRWRVRIGY